MNTKLNRMYRDFKPRNHGNYEWMRESRMFIVIDEGRRKSEGKPAAVRETIGDRTV